MNRHIKNYNNISIQLEKFTKKSLIYANPTSEEKIIRIRLNQESNPYVKLKENKIKISPCSNGMVRLRMYFDRTANMKQEVILEIIDEEVIEELHFHITLYS